LKNIQLYCIEYWFVMYKECLLVMVIFERPFYWVVWVILAGLPCIRGQDAPANHFSVSVVDGTIRIDEYVGPGGQVNVPGMIDGKPVTVIGRQSFKDNATITGVHLPDTVVEIESSAFSMDNAWNNVFETIHLGNSLEKIGNNAFSDCTKLQNVTLPDSLTDIGNGAFQDCETFTAIEIPPKITILNRSVFNSCAFLETLVLHEGLVTIDDLAFTSCIRLKTLNFPASLRTIGLNAFALTGVSTLNFQEGIEVIDDFAFRNIQAFSVVLPDSLKELGTGAFSQSSLRSVTFGDQLESIGTNAFLDCRFLQHVSIPDSVTSLGSSAFKSCWQLQTVSLGEGLTSVPSSAFYDNRALHTVDFGESITSIGSYAFQKCGALTSIEIPDSVTRIEGKSFAECGQLETVIFGEGLTSFGGGAYNEPFRACPNLTDAFFKGNAPSYSLVFEGPSSAELTIHRLAVKTGWPDFGQSWAGYPTVEWLFGAVAAPTVNRPGGAYATSTLPVVVEQGRENSTLRYTLDGTDPTTSSTSVGHGDTISVPVTGTLKLRAWHADFDPSRIVTVEYVRATGLSAFTWRTVNDEIVIDDYHGSAAHVVVPTYINGFDVVQINYDAFRGIENLESVTLPSQIGVVSSRAFAECRDLKAVYFDGPRPTSGGNLFVGSHQVKVYHSATGAGWTYLGGSFEGCPVEAFGSAAELAPTFVPEAGAYPEEPLTLQVSKVSPVGAIHYNISFSTPNANSPVVPANGEVEVTPDTFMRASVYEGTQYLGLSRLARYTVSSPASDFLIQENAESITITGYTGPGGEVIVPNYLNGKPVTAFAALAFANQSVITTLHFGQKVAQIDPTAFDGASGLTDIVAADYGPAFSSVDGILYDNSRRTLVRYPPGRTEAFFELPEWASKIGRRAFAGHSNLERLLFGDQLTGIQDGAFDQMGALQEVIFYGHAPTTDSDPFGSTSAVSVFRFADKTGWPAFGSTWFGQTVQAIEITEPEFSIVSGAYSGDGVHVELTIATEGARIRYETNGSDPNEYSPSVESGEILFIPFPGRLHVQGWKKGFPDTPVLRAHYREATAVTDFTYERIASDTEIRLTDYLGEDADVVVPSVIEGLPVTALGPETFASRPALLSLDLPESITDIGDRSFAENPQLAAIRFHGAPPTAGTDLFLNTGAVELFAPVSSTSWPSSWQGVGVSAWTPGGVVLPGLSPGAGAYDSTTVVTVTHPDPAATIRFTTNGADPTESSPAIASGGTLNIGRPWTLKTKAWLADGSQSAVHTAEYIDASHESHFQFQIEADDTATVTLYLGPGGSVNIPSFLGGKPVRRIGLSVFSMKASLTSIILPRGVTHIGENAFSGSEYQGIRQPFSDD
jgi:hypothetical protein